MSTLLSQQISQSPNRVNSRSVNENCIQNSPTSQFKFWSKILNKTTININTKCGLTCSRHNKN